MVKKIETIDAGSGAPAAPGTTSSLDALAAEADKTLAPPPLGEGVTDLDVDAQENGAAPAVPVMTNAQCLMMATQMVREAMITVAKLETPKVTLADATIQPAADALGAVFDKHGWNLQALAGDYMVEFTALTIAAPIAWTAYKGVQGEIKARPTTDVSKPAGAVTSDKLPESIEVDPTAKPQFPPGDPRNVTLDGK